MDHKEGMYKVRDLGLADAGRMRIEWAESRMPVLGQLRVKYRAFQPFKGYKITGCLHVTKETAVLVETFAVCGAEVIRCPPTMRLPRRLPKMAHDGKLLYPVYAVNDTETKWDFNNVYGTGQSTLD